MDLQLYFRVFWRFRVLVVIGLMLAFSLALLSYVRVSFEDGMPAFSYRQNERWSSTGTLFITQQGFPLGRAIYDDFIPLEDQQVVPRFSDPTRFSSYSLLFARLATSDRVRARMLEAGPVPGVVVASPAAPANNPSVALPLVEISGIANSASAAEDVASRAVNSLVEYVRSEQVRNKIPKDRRVVLQVVTRPRPATLIEGRSTTRPVFFFVAALMLVVGLVFVLENLRPRIRSVASEPDAARRTAESSRRLA